jgi:hypothetical protein
MILKGRIFQITEHIITNTTDEQRAIHQISSETVLSSAI